MPRQPARYIQIREAIAKTHRALYAVSEHLSDDEVPSARDMVEVAMAHLRAIREQMQARSRP